MYPDPLLMLGLFALVALGAAALFWPRRGPVARVMRLRRETERVRLEDVLKHLHDYERGGRSGTLENVAGRLEVSRGAASELLSRLDERGLAEAGTTGWELTEAGRAYALRILRTHRLWERYLADRTGVPPAQWHAEAERVEHELTQGEAEQLAARLGHPRYDPHGDPIPTPEGEIPERAGMPLSRVDAGRTVIVRHLEDEPPEVFDRLVAAGLAPGLIVEVLDRTPAGVRVRIGGAERVLRSVDAANVTVERAAEGATAAGPVRTLADASPAEEVRVTGISPSCQGLQRRRLLDLGVVPGTRVTPELVSTAGDPVAYRIRGALIALRRQQASLVEIEAAEQGITQKAG